MIFGVMAFTLFATVFIERKAESRLYTDVTNIPRNRVALLLGTTPINYWGQPSPTFTDRVNTAAALYKAGKTDYIIASGSSRFNHLDETGAMRDGLIERGVPADRILIDTAGYRTATSIERAKTVFGLDTITIVSQGSHGARALLIAERKGMNAIAICAPDTGKKVFPVRTFLRECFARDKMLLEYLFY